MARSSDRDGTKSTNTIAEDLHLFVEWVNTYCRSRDRGDGVPVSAERLSASRFRRTLAGSSVAARAALSRPRSSMATCMFKSLRATAAATRRGFPTISRSSGGWPGSTSSTRPTAASTRAVTSADPPPMPTVPAWLVARAGSPAASSAAARQPATCWRTRRCRSIRAGA